MTITSVAPEIDRDRFGRPLVVPPDGGKVTPYTRCTTYIDCLDDRWNLERWKCRMTALGLSQRHDLQLAVVAHREDDKRLNQIVDEALDAAASSAKATIGTALHALCEQIDRGQEPPHVPQEFQADLEAYRQAMAAAKLKITHVEQFMVLDYLKVAGTPDRIVRHKGKYYIADLKGLALTTPLPTPDGWTTMGEVRVGDQVFGSDGRPCRVTVKSATKRIGTYVVTFDDGSTVVCDREHIWWTTAGRRNRAEPTAKPIHDIIATLRYQGQTHHRVPVADPLELPDADLPIDPYLLGCWLGDGHARDGCITKEDALFDILAADGHQLGVRQVQPLGKEHVATRTVRGLTGALHKADLLHNKHVPAAYLRASYGQRLRLLQGLMDTDGTWNTARRRASFTTTDKAMALAVEELLLTLGQRPHLAVVPRTGFGLTVTAYDVEFTPVDVNPFRLARKADQADASTKPTFCARRRLIVSVEPGPDVETACIGVDSADHTYLCGERMIPTHNTGNLDYGNAKIACQLAIYSRSKLYDIVTGERTGINIELDKAIVIHLPQGAGTCTLAWVDLIAGYRGVQLAGHVRKWRQGDKGSAFMVPFTGEVADPIAVLIAQAVTVESLTELWRAHKDSGWTAAHSGLAADRKSVLTAIDG